MTDADNSFTHATDSLIALYRSVERRTIDLPLLSVTPFLIVCWEIIKFFVGLLLVVPVNLVILIRNFLPGHWKYQPFFMRQFRYIWLWVWRGEVLSVPYIFVIFVRPLFNAFVKGHFANRLRRLRLEIILHNEISDDTRAALVNRIDAALERLKSPRLAIFTVLLPGIISASTWIAKVFPELFGSVSIHPVETFMSVSQQIAIPAVLVTVAYLLAIPGTAFLAKRGLFIGRPLNRICFPGGQEGGEVYFKEKEILAGVGLQVREAQIDFWIVGISLSLLLTQFLLVTRSTTEDISFWVGGLLPSIITLVALVIAAIRRISTGRL